MQAALLVALDDGHAIALVGDLAQRILARVVHGRGGGHRRGIEGLHLVRTEAVALEPEGEVHHVLVRGTRMRGDEVRDQVLLLARLLGVLLEHLLEAVVAADAGLHHLVQRTALGVLGRDLQVAADMVGDQFLDVLGRFHSQVVSQPRGDQDLLHPRQCPRLAVELDQGRVIGVEVLADAGEHARRLAAVALDLRVLASDAVHVGGRPAEVRDHAGKARYLVAHLLDLTDDRVMGAILDDPAFVLGDGAEGAATKAATHDVHRETDHLVGRDLFLAIGRVRHARIGHAEHVVHFLGGHGDGRRREPDVHVAMPLHQRPGVARVGFQVQHAVGVCIEHRVVAHLLEGRQADHRLVAGHARAFQQLHHLGFVGILNLTLGLLDGAGLGVLGVHIGIDDLVDATGTVDAGRVDLEPALGRIATDEGGAAHIGDGLDALATRQALGDLHHRPLGVAIEQDVGGGVHQDRAADLVLPVVVVGDPAQRGLDAAEHDRHVAVGLLAALAVDQAGAIRSLAGDVARGIGIVGTDLLVRGVAVDHGVHVARGHPEEQIRLAELHEVVLRLPVRLGDDAHAEALGLQQPTDDGHAKGRVIDVGVPGDDDDVAAVPAELLHLRPTHGQEGCRTKALGPVFRIVEQRRGGLHGSFRERGVFRRARRIAQKMTS